MSLASGDAFGDASGLWKSEEYSLLDFGRERKLERFGGVVLDRPCPAAEHVTPSAAELWRSADVVLNDDGAVERGQPPPKSWQIAFDSIRLSLAITPFGHVGVFPEQATNWRWLQQTLEKLFGVVGSSGPESRGIQPKVLNLFAYTGASTLLCATRGCRVVHLDSSAPAVAWARRNAELSHLASAPIRWIVEDARKFAARELRRGSRYQAILLDPPTYGHGTQGQRWEIARDLPTLLHTCCQLLDPEGGLLLISCHSQEISAAMIIELVRNFYFEFLKVRVAIRSAGRSRHKWPVFGYGLGLPVSMRAKIMPVDPSQRYAFKLAGAERWLQCV